MTPSLRRQTPPPPAAANGRARWPPRCPGGGARLEEAEQGWGRGDRSPGGGTGARGGASGPAGLRTGTPGDGDARPSPSPRRLAAYPAGRSRPPGVTRRFQSLDSPPREESPGRGPSGHRAPAASQAGTRVYHRSVSEPQVGRRRGPAHAPPPSPSSPRCSSSPPPLHSRPPSSRVTRVDGRRGARAGPWRSR